MSRLKLSMQVISDHELLRIEQGPKYDKRLSRTVLASVVLLGAVPTDAAAALATRPT